MSLKSSYPILRLLRTILVICLINTGLPYSLLHSFLKYDAV